MSKNLVIVESPAKAKTIEKFLWTDYKVVASYWHIRDLPEKNIWVDIDNNFSPIYEVSKDKEKNVDSLKKLAKTHHQIWIATDEDREWEAIGWHLCNILNLDPKNVKRIVFHEITKEAILNSIKSPRNIDLNLVDAQQARRILDRLVWYKVSPILWNKIKKWLSAWRVQSVAVKLVVEKEREIQNFKSEESWKIQAILKYEKYSFKTTLIKIWWKNKNLKSIEDVKKLLHTLFDNCNIIESKDKKDNIVLQANQNIDFKLLDTQIKDSKRSPNAPFTTSTLQQEASRKFGFPVKQTMMLAQKLYEWVDLWWERVWLITYMRTDSVNLSKTAVSQASEIIKNTFWEKYLKNRVFKTKSSNAQEAHEAIRPTYLSRSPESLKSVLDPKELKLYTLIWKRTIASQMSDAIIEKTDMFFSPLKNENQTWLSSWEVIKFDWFIKLYMESKDDEEEDEENASLLPNIPLNEIVKSSWVESIQTFSNPPARYAEASLVKKLESEWIWRPSTYAPTISTIIDRWYIEKYDKKYLKPTDIAFLVNDFLEEYFVKLMDYKFTKKVEENFDEIASWEKTYQDMLWDFWSNTLKKDLENASQNSEKIIQKVWKSCPKCWNDLVYKFSKLWKFIWCSYYPECDYTEKTKEENSMMETLKQKYEWKPCPEWVPGTIVVKIWRFWPFLASSEYPNVKWIWKIKDDKEEILEEILNERWLLIDEDTKEELVVKNSKRWPFLRAKNYPQVKIAKNIPKDVWDEVKKRLSQKEEE